MLWRLFCNRSLSLSLFRSRSLSLSFSPSFSPSPLSLPPSLSLSLSLQVLDGPLPVPSLNQFVAFGQTVSGALSPDALEALETINT